MSWVTEKIRAIKKRKNDPNQQQHKNVHFDEYVPQKYQELLLNIEKEKKDIEHSLLSLSQEQKQIADNPSRGLIRRKTQLVKEISKLNEKLQVLCSGKKIEEFKEKILLYSEAYEREIQVAAVDKLKEIANVSSLLPKDTPDSKGIKISGVMKDFMQEVENIPTEIKIMPSEICEECDDVMILESRSSTLVCSFCGNWRPHLDATSSHMAYGEEVEFTAFAYLRLNHFNERLTYSQAKESTRIDRLDVEKVMDRLIEKRITDPEKITMEMTYDAAKELKMRHVYKQNTQLWCRITCKPPPRMTPEQEEQLRSMFKAVNRLWIKYKPEERKNFLSYNYCLYKFCEILGLPQKS